MMNESVNYSDSEIINRPGVDEYMMGIALSVRSRANCIGNRVGSIIVKDGRIVSTGYNGTPYDMPNCDESGCVRCSNRDKFKSGTAYDLCICVHAEQNALLAAARFGIACEGALIFTTLRPCFGCTKELLQAKISGVRYLHEWQHPEENAKAQYDRLQARFSDGVKHIKIDDPDRSWATTSLRDEPTNS